MPDKDPTTYSLFTYGWVIVLSVVGGIVNFANRIKSGSVRVFNFTEFFGELMTSGFAGLLTFWLCEAAEINKLVAAVLIAISGHMGTRAIFMIERWAEEKFGK